MENYKTILATTYAVNPFKGSEDGMGWNFVCQVARFNRVIAITRLNNRVHIEKYMNENPNDLYNNIQFLYFDLPYWLRFWKRGGTGAMLYYWMWQKGVVSFIKKQNIKFDIVHNINFHNDCTPSYLWKLEKPFVWGPIGHHPIIPNQYLEPYRSSYWIKDRIAWIIKKAFWKFSFSLRKTIKMADVVLCMNSSVSKVINLKNKNYLIMPSVATEDFGYEPLKNEKKFTVISAGRLVPLKGFDLSIIAFASFIKRLPEQEREKCNLIIIGSGPEQDYYEKLCLENNINRYVQFINWIDRSELMQIFKSSSAFLFPSHEGAGMVVSEALSFGLPVISLDNSGPGEFIDEACGYTIKIQDYSSTIKDLSQAIFELFDNIDIRLKLSRNARSKFVNDFHWDRRGESLYCIYSKL